MTLDGNMAGDGSEEGGGTDISHQLKPDSGKLSSINLQFVYPF